MNKRESRPGDPPPHEPSAGLSLTALYALAALALAAAIGLALLIVLPFFHRR
jgi:hypothetical protein